jgi:hypothetical protein
MSDTTDTPKLPDLAPRLDELLALIRTALAQDAGSDARSAGAIACRAILGALDPTSRAGVPPVAAAPPIPTSPAATSPAATSPIVTLLGAIGQVPREQLLEVIGGLRWLLGQQGPTYRTRPAPVPPRAPSGGT